MWHHITTYWDTVCLSLCPNCETVEMIDLFTDMVPDLVDRTHWGGLKINLRLPEIWQKKKKFNYIALIKYHCPKNIEILKWQSKLILSPQDEGEFQLKVQLSSVWHRKKKHFCSTKYWYLFVLYWIIFTSLQMICSRSEKGNWFGWTVHTYWIESRSCFRIRSHEPKTFGTTPRHSPEKMHMFKFKSSQVRFTATS